jgi:hypothetical protein
MKDRKFLRSLAGLLESLPAMGHMRKDMGRRLRAIAETIPDEQDTSTQKERNDPSIVETIVTDALPKGVFVFAAPPPLDGMPPTITGSAVGGKMYGAPKGLGWVYTPKDDAEAFARLAMDIQDGIITKEHLFS